MNKSVLKAIVFIIGAILLFIFSFIVGTTVLNKSEESKQEEVNIENNISNESEEENNIKKEEKNFFDGKVLEIRGNELIVENPSHLVDYSIYESDTRWHYNHQVIIDGKLYLTAGYLLNIDNIEIKDSSGNRMDNSKLKVGDDIKVFTRDIEYTINTIFTTLTSENIVLIEKKSNN